MKKETLMKELIRQEREFMQRPNEFTVYEFIEECLKVDFKLDRHRAFRLLQKKVRKGLLSQRKGLINGTETLFYSGK
jgi:hypothetical protein